MVLTVERYDHQFDSVEELARQVGLIIPGLFHFTNNFYSSFTIFNHGHVNGFQKTKSFDPGLNIIIMISHTSKPKSAYVDEVNYQERLDSLPSQQQTERTIENLEKRGFITLIVDDKSGALKEIKDRIPDGATIMKGHSTTLEEIGFIDHLAEDDHDWHDLHDEILATDDDEKVRDIRRVSQTADYLLGSISAIAESGELVAAEASGSRIGAYPLAVNNLLLVSGITTSFPVSKLLVVGQKKSSIPMRRRSCTRRVRGKEPHCEGIHLPSGKRGPQNHGDSRQELFGVLNHVD